MIMIDPRGHMVLEFCQPGSGSGFKPNNIPFHSDSALVKEYAKQGLIETKDYVVQELHEEIR